MRSHYSRPALEARESDDSSTATLSSVYKSPRRQFRDSRAASMSSISSSIRSTTSSIRRRMSGVFSNTNPVTGRKRVCLTCIMGFSAGLSSDHCKRPREWNELY